MKPNKRDTLAAAIDDLIARGGTWEQLEMKATNTPFVLD